MSVQTAFPVIDLAATGRCIERQRRQAGLTVRDLQAYFGFEYPQAIYKWQHGECLPSVDNLLALARVLRVPMEDLLVYDDREVSYFWAAVFRGISLNHRFNDKRPGLCYDISIDREHDVPDVEVRQRTDFGERRISCRAQAHTAALSVKGQHSGNEHARATTQAV